MKVSYSSKELKQKSSVSSQPRELTAIHDTEPTLHMPHLVLGLVYRKGQGARIVGGGHIKGRIVKFNVARGERRFDSRARGW